MISWRIWRGLYASDEAHPFFTGIRQGVGLGVLWRIGGAVILILLMTVLGFSLFYAPLYNTLLGVLVIPRSRSLIHRLNQLDVYDVVATTPLGSVGVWWQCLRASFFRWLILVWVGFLFIALIAAIGGAIESLFVDGSPDDALFALPLMAFIILVFLDMLLSVSLGCLVTLIGAAFDGTFATRLLTEGGIVTFRLMLYIFVFPNDLIQVGGITRDEVIGLFADALLYFALMLGAHEVLWYALGRRVGDERNALGGILG
jgi:hypothetical protein